MALCYPDTAIWPDPSVLPEPPVDPDNPTDEELLAQQKIDIALGLAWSTLQVLSAYQISICPITVRPCKQACAWGTYFIAPVVGPAGSSYWPYVRNGQWFNMTCGHEDGCGCSTVQQVALLGPVGGIVSVTVDGIDLDPSAYRIDDGYKLVRQDGEGWPLCQNFDKPLGEEGTWSVTYYHGATADLLVRYAAGLLAAEWLAGMETGECRLPSGTVAAVRQGLTIEIEKDMFENGLTGIAEVDAVTARYNPFRQKMPSAFFNPDAPRQRQTMIGG